MRAFALFAVLTAVTAVPAAPQQAPFPAHHRTSAVTPAVTPAVLHRWRAAHEHEVLRELTTLLAIPNLASDSAGIARNADTLLAMLRRRGFAATRLDGEGGPSPVFGELRVPGATRTVVFYAHYDGQPVDSTQWTDAPWTPVLRDAMLERGGRPIPLPTPGDTVSPEARLYARSASDDKAPIVAILAALDALKASGRAPSVNVKLFLDGEEEAGSPHLARVLRDNAARLAGDVWLFCDGPIDQSRRQVVSFGVRGIQELELTVYGPARPLHDGHYGGWAPNPGAELVRLLAGMRDTSGRITIARFYDDVRAPTAEERRAIAALPDDDAALARELALGRTEGSGARLPLRLMLPTLNIRGLALGHVGAQASNTIATEARASLDFRLVPDETPARIRALVERHLAAHGWTVVHDAPDLATRRAHPRVVRVQWGEGAYPASRADMSSALARAVVAAVAEGTGAPVLRVPTEGGSLPMYLFGQELHAPLVIVPIVNHDNNQHAANENLRLRNLWDGIAIYGTLLARLDPLWRAAGRPAARAASNGGGGR